MDLRSVPHFFILNNLIVLLFGSYVLIVSQIL